MSLAETFFLTIMKSKQKLPSLFPWPSFSNFMHLHALLKTLVLGFPSPYQFYLSSQGCLFVFKFSFIFNLHNPKLQIRQSLNWTHWVNRKQEILPVPTKVLLPTTSANSVPHTLGLFPFHIMNCWKFWRI